MTVRFSFNYTEACLRVLVLMSKKAISVIIFALLLIWSDYTLIKIGAYMAKQRGDFFTQFTSKVSAWLGRPWIFMVALAVLVAWGVSGPILNFSDTWQLVINTGTTIITFLMVFIIQNTQNRDNLAMNIKLDVIMRELGVTKEELLEAEDQSDKILEKRIKKLQQKSERKTAKKK